MTEGANEEDEERLVAAIRSERLAQRARVLERVDRWIRTIAIWQPPGPPQRGIDETRPSSKWFLDLNSKYIVLPRNLTSFQLSLLSRERIFAVSNLRLEEPNARRTRSMGKGPNRLHRLQLRNTSLAIRERGWIRLRDH